MASNIDEELHSMVKDIVDELEAAVSGTLYDVDGNETVIDDMDDWKAEQYMKRAGEFREKHPKSEFEKLKEEDRSFDLYEEWMEDEIGSVDDIDEPDSMSLDEYIEKRGLGDTRFEVDTSRQILGGRTLFCCGGPNIWVHDDEVCGYWGSSQCTMGLDSETSSALWDWFEQYWETVRE